MKRLLNVSSCASDRALNSSYLLSKNLGCSCWLIIIPSISRNSSAASDVVILTKVSQALP